MTEHSMKAALAQCAEGRALLVGDLVLDAYVFGETGRVSREAPVMIVEKRNTEYRLGGAANTAANLAAIGMSTAVVCTLGDDEGGRVLSGRLDAAGVDVNALHPPGYTTPVKTRVLAGAVGTAKQQVLRIDEEPKVPLSREVQTQIADLVEENALSAEVVVVSDYGLGTVGDLVIDAVCRLAARGVRVVVDSRYRLHDYSGVTAVTPNVPEAEVLSGIAIRDDDSIERVGQAILDRVGCATCLLTLGRGGMRLFSEGRSIARVPIVGTNEVSDVTGAGDTVTAVFAAALSAGLGEINAMRMANVAAGIVVNKMGTATASPDEVIAMAERYGVELDPWAAY